MHLTFAKLFGHIFTLRNKVIGGVVLDGKKKTGQPMQTENFLPALVVLSFLDVSFFHQE